jgi:hypothetical protein
MGSWEEVFLFSMDFTVSQNFLELELQDADFCLKKLAFADCVYCFLTSLESCISRGIFYFRECLTVKDLGFFLG